MTEHFELEPIGQDDPEQEHIYIHTEEVRLNTENLTDNNGRNSDIRDPPKAPVNYRNLAIAAILFIVLLVLLFYWLSISFTKNQDSTDKTQTITNMQGKVKYILTIRYTDYVKEIDDTTRNCTKLNNDADKLGIGDIAIVRYMRFSKKCLCTKQIWNQRILSDLHCCACRGYFPICQNGGHRYPGCMHSSLSDVECGVCFCPEEYTGKYCQLSKKLECGKCIGTSCDDFLPCHKSTVRPCREFIDLQKMSCTNPEYSGDYCHLPKKLECDKCIGALCDEFPPCNKSTVRPCREFIDLQKMSCTNPGFPYVLGCVDDSQIKILKPRQNKQIYRTGKNAIR